MGELHDTCNDYCQYTGYAGCDFDRMVEINRIPRARRLLESLNYTCNVSDGDWNQAPTYRPDLGGCYYNRNALSCDANKREENQPVCTCNGTAPPPAPLASCAASNTLLFGDKHASCLKFSCASPSMCHGFGLKLVLCCSGSELGFGTTWRQLRRHLRRFRQSLRCQQNRGDQSDPSGQAAAAEHELHMRRERRAVEQAADL